MLYYPRHPLNDALTVPRQGCSPADYNPCPARYHWQQVQLGYKSNSYVESPSPALSLIKEREASGPRNTVPQQSNSKALRAPV